MDFGTVIPGVRDELRGLESPATAAGSRGCSLERGMRDPEAAKLSDRIHSVEF